MRKVFKTISDIFVGTFDENSERLLAVFNYFRQYSIEDVWQGSQHTFAFQPLCQTFIPCKPVQVGNDKIYSDFDWISYSLSTFQ